MLFKNEQDLQRELETLDFEFYDSHPIKFTRREYPVGGRIPDLISVHFRKDPNTHSWPNKWSHKHSFVIWLLRRQKLFIEDIALLFFEPVEKVLPILDELLLNKIIVEAKDGKISLSKQVKDVRADVVAVEVKLKRWRQALVQAVRYKEFANIVFVAMDATMTPRADQPLQIFRDQQIGLCAVSHGIIEWVVYPKIRMQGIGHEKEYLVMSATIPKTQKLWSRRNSLTASNHA